MRILVIGSGGREHALVWKINQSEPSHTVFAAPGNAGMASGAECVPIAADDIDAIIEFAENRAVDLVVVGPEAPLAAGLCDQLNARGISVFGPGRDAARLESSKIYSKEFCGRHGIPTASFAVCTSPADVRQAAGARNHQCVVKADGLAAGKGVFVCRSTDDVEAAIAAMFIDRSFGDASRRVLVEDCLTGEEASILALVDGKTYRLLESSQDHKAAYDGDTGPNTGGMGAVSPAPGLDEALE
nr:phosphoribosylamine--glycine ligase [bacterium]